MHGDAGAGKSSIAQTFALKCSRERRLLASFFFWGNDALRSSHTALVATLIHQALTAVPALRPLVAAAMQRDPSILEKNLEHQLFSLLIEPLNELISRPSFDHAYLPSLILIDGLDECSGANHQCSILKAFTEVLPHCHRKIRILVTSRAEVEIKAMFNSGPLLQLSTRVALDASFKPDADIRNFLIDKFDEVRSKHPLGPYIPASWPGNHVIPTLVNRSSGQFIFASTVGKYISDPNQKPSEQLDIIMAVRPAPTDTNMPYTELNALYTHVLTCLPFHKIEKALDILFFIILLRPYFSDPSWTPLPGRRRTEDALCSILSLEPADLVFYLVNLSSIVEVNIDDAKRHFPTVRLSHTSLGDFLLDPHRSRRFYRHPETFISKVLCVYLEHPYPSAESLYSNQSYLFNWSLTCFSSAGIRFWFQKRGQYPVLALGAC